MLGQRVNLCNQGCRVRRRNTGNRVYLLLSQMSLPYVSEQILCLWVRTKNFERNSVRLQSRNQSGVLRDMPGEVHEKRSTHRGQRLVDSSHRRGVRQDHRNPKRAAFSPSPSIEGRHVLAPSHIHSRTGSGRSRSG